MNLRILPSGTAPASDAEAGMVAGAEALAFGVLVFVFGTLVILNGWAVIDAKFATSAAAREAVRAILQAPVEASSSELRERAEGAARRAFVAHGRDGESVLVTPSPGALALRRCAEVEVVAATSVRSALVPGLRGPEVFVVRSSHVELVDPFRSGLPEGLHCAF